MHTPTPLPNDVEVLKQLVADRDGLIAKLLAEIARLKRWQFGRSSERLDATLAQLQLALGDLPAAPPPARATAGILAGRGVDASSGAEPRAAVPPRTARVSGAPAARDRWCTRRRVATVPDCGGAMRHLGEDVSEMLDLVPGYFKVIRHVRPKLSCGHCARVIQQPAPSRPIDRGMAAPGLLAQIIVAKYADHCPLYRQQGIYRRSGVELDRATLAAWVGDAAQLARTAGRDARYAMCARRRRCTPTTRRCRCSTPDVARPRPGDYGRTCAMIGRRPVAIRRRCGIATRRIARASIRTRTCAASAASCRPTPTAASRRCTTTGEIVEAACWAHARRKFYDLYVVERSPIAAEAMQRIGALYAIERDIRGHLPAQRVRVRQERAGPLLDAFHVWLHGDPADGVGEVGAGRRDQVRAGALARAHPLSRRRSHRDRQQQRRALDPAGGPRAGATICLPARTRVASARPASTA